MEEVLIISHRTRSVLHIRSEVRLSKHFYHNDEEASRKREENKKK